MNTTITDVRFMVAGATSAVHIRYRNNNRWSRVIAAAENEDMAGVGTAVYDRSID